VELRPTEDGVGDKEFDEDDVEVYGGDRNVLSSSGPDTADEGPAPSSMLSADAAGLCSTTPPAAAGEAGDETISTSAAPAPVGAYPHARRVGDLLYLSGVGPRQPETNAIPGGPIVDAAGQPTDYDIAAQTRAVIENVRVILEASGSSLEQVVDITVFLVDMDRDFAGYNAVYKEVFEPIQATRTTLAIRALPTPIAVEFKVIARAGDGVSSGPRQV
jgi:2-aminomuconate deaminase